jgi:hypothetical protein
VQASQRFKSHPHAPPDYGITCWDDNPLAQARHHEQNPGSSALLKVMGLPIGLEFAESDDLRRLGHTSAELPGPAVSRGHSGDGLTRDSPGMPTPATPGPAVRAGRGTSAFGQPGRTRSARGCRRRPPGPAHNAAWLRRRRSRHRRPHTAQEALPSRPAFPCHGTGGRCPKDPATPQPVPPPRCAPAASRACRSTAHPVLIAIDRIPSCGPRTRARHRIRPAAGVRRVHPVEGLARQRSRGGRVRPARSGLPLCFTTVATTCTSSIRRA